MKAIITDANFQIQIGTFILYKCSSCYGNDIKTNYQYCPHCGVELVFDIENEDDMEEFVDECEIRTDR